MINDISVENFKCFEHLEVDDCKRVNVIVGDNGAGKTALLEAIFMGLGMTSELVLRFRQARGLANAFHGTPRKIEDAVVREFFYNFDINQPISICLNGTGPENRSLKISRSAGETKVSAEAADKVDERETTVGVRFVWTDSEGVEHAVNPIISSRELRFPDTNEDLPDFFFFASNQTYPSIETAERFSDLSRARRQKQFVDLFTTEYNWIENLGIEISAGSPAIYASVRGLKDKISIASVSGGINRIMTILLTIASRQTSVVLVDEIENGLYYTHHQSYWRSLLAFARDFNSQLFLTTHSKEWLEALIKAAGNDIDDIALLRMERGESGRLELFKFEGSDLKSGIEYGAEVRGGSD